MLLRYFVYCLMMLSFSVSADTLDNYVKSMPEQEKVVEWVRDVTGKRVSTTTAAAIVSESYAQSLSKGLSPKLVLAIIQVESNFKSHARSSYDARGLMQVVPRFHKDKLKGRNAYLDKVSTEVGTTVLKDCFVKHKQNTFKSLDCYSGRGGKKYYNKVMAQQIDLVLNLRSTDVLVVSR